MRLRRLATSLSPEVAALIPPLDLLGYKSTDQIAFTPPSIIQKHILTSPSCLLFTFSTFTILRETCIEAEAGRFTTDAAEAFFDEAEKMKDLHWDGFGVDGLDGLMEGFPGSGVIEVCGPREVGKSLLVLHVALRHIAFDPLATCTWIDTEGSFSPERAAGILEAWHISNVEEVLGRIELVSCFEVEEAGIAIQTVGRELLQSELSDKQEFITSDANRRTHIVVIDCVTTLLAPLVAGHSAQGYAAMVEFMMELTSLVRQYNLLCLLIQSVTSSIPSNPTSAFSTTTIKPSLGTTFALYTDVTLLIQKARDVFVMDETEKSTERRVVEVVKRKDGPAGTWTVFDTVSVLGGGRLYDAFGWQDIDWGKKSVDYDDQDGIRLFDVMPT